MDPKFAAERSRFASDASWLATIIGVLIVAVGLLGLLSPETYVRLGWFWAVPPGMFIVALVQLAIGFVFVRAAPASRSPIALGLLGAFALADAALMPLLGYGRARVIAQWWGAQTNGNLRLWALLELVIGLLVIFTVAPRRRPAVG